MTSSNAARAAPAIAGGDPQKSSCLAADRLEISKKPAHVQDTLDTLKCDFIAECLRIVALKASHGADNIEIGDRLNAERDIRLAVDNLREAAKAFRELGLLKEGASK
jgi:hypothetical protein